jgi:universal stress protein A
VTRSIGTVEARPSDPAHARRSHEANAAAVGAWFEGDSVMAIAKTLLVPTDFSEGATIAFDYACDLAAALGATLHLVTSLGASLPELPHVLSGTRIEAERAEALVELEQLAASRRPLVNVSRTIVKDGDAREAILQAAEEVGADMIVMSTHGRKGIKRAIIGSVAEHVVRRASCPVLTIRA